jgi:hypothetical protein
VIAPCARNNFSPPVLAIYRKRSERARRGIWLIPSDSLFRYLLGLAANSSAAYTAMQKARTTEVDQ